MMLFIVRMMLFIVVEVAGGVRGKQNLHSSGFLWKKFFILQFWVTESAKPWAQAILVQTQQRRTRPGGFFQVVFRCFSDAWSIWREDTVRWHQAPVGPGSHGSGQGSLLLSLLFTPGPSPHAQLWAELERLQGYCYFTLFHLSRAPSRRGGAGKGPKQGPSWLLRTHGAGLQPLGRRDAWGAWHCHPCSERVSKERE